MKKSTVILLVFLGILTCGVLVYVKFFLIQHGINLPAQGTQLLTTDLKTFQSTTLGFIVQIPPTYEVGENFTHIEFIKDGNLIGGDRNDASGFGSLQEFIDDFDNKNQSEEIFDSKELDINNNPSVVRVEGRGGAVYKMYYIYVDGWVYVFSTESEFLYSDLDQIAKSFQYTP
jgi:hypothetical protein